jgi:hypothetical protein
MLIREVHFFYSYNGVTSITSKAWLAIAVMGHKKVFGGDVMNFDDR